MVDQREDRAVVRHPVRVELRPRQQSRIGQTTDTVARREIVKPEAVHPPSGQARHRQRDHPSDRHWHHGAVRGAGHVGPLVVAARGSVPDIDVVRVVENLRLGQIRVRRTRYGLAVEIVGRSSVYGLIRLDAAVA